MANPGHIVGGNAHTQACTLQRSAFNGAGATQPGRALLYGADAKVTRQHLGGAKALAVVAHLQHQVAILAAQAEENGPRAHA